MSKTSTPLEAVAVAVEDSSSIRILQIPAGHADLGMEFAGSPPQVVRIDPSCIFEGRAEIGLYVHVLRLPELEIVNIRDSQHLMQLLQANVALVRELWLSPSPSYADASLGSTHTGALYKHTLPVTEDLGVLLVSLYYGLPWGFTDMLVLFLISTTPMHHFSSFRVRLPFLPLSTLSATTLP